MSDAMAILEKVNTFYSGAFTQLIAFTVALLTLVGIIVPWIQSRQLARDRKDFLAHISAEMAGAKEILKAQLEAESANQALKLKHLVEEVKADFDKKIARADAGRQGVTLHLQAMAFEKTTPALSLMCSMRAIPFFVAAAEESNLTASLLLAKDLWDKIPGETAMKDEIKDATESAMEALRTLNSTGRYSTDIRETKMNLEKLFNKPR